MIRITYGWRWRDLGHLKVHKPVLSSNSQLSLLPGPASVISCSTICSSLQYSHVRLLVSSCPGLSLRGQFDQILCAGIVHKASLRWIWEHMEKPRDNGALVPLASTKRPRQAQTGGWKPCWVCVCKRERGSVTVCVNVTKQKLIYIACVFTRSYSSTVYSLYFQSTHQRAVKVSAVLTDTCHVPCLCWLSA